MRMWRKNILIISVHILLLQTPLGGGDRPVPTVLFRSIEKYGNPKYIDYFYSNISDQGLSMNMALNQIKTTPADFWVKVALTYKNLASRKYRPIVTFNMNLCHLLSKALNRQSLVHLWIRSLLKYGNIPRTCPWKPGYYHWLNLRPEKGSIPIFASSGTYRTLTKFYFKDFNNELFANVTLLLDIKTN